MGYNKTIVNFSWEVHLIFKFKFFKFVIHLCQFINPFSLSVLFSLTQTNHQQNGVTFGWPFLTSNNSHVYQLCVWLSVFEPPTWDLSQKKNFCQLHCWLVNFAVGMVPTTLVGTVNMSTSPVKQKNLEQESGILLRVQVWVITSHLVVPKVQEVKLSSLIGILQ